MPDGSNPALPLSGLYPQAPQPQQNALTGDPARLIGLASEVQRMQLLRAQMPALAQQPAANLANTQLANVTARMQQQADAQRRVAAGLGSMIPDGAKEDDVHSAVTYFARSNPDIAVNYPEMLPAASDVILNHPKGIKYGASVLLNSALPPEAASGRVTGPPTAGGAPTTISVPQANLGGPRGIVTGLPAGEGTALEASAGRGANLSGTASTTAQYHADLENLKQESQTLGVVGGPTEPFEKKANQVLQRFGISGIGTMTPDQLRAAEGFDKISNQISLAQGQMFGGTDASRSMTVGANPSTSMSQYGREGVIDMLQGNQDAIDTARNAWLDARAKGAPANSHDVFTNQLSKILDPRVFQFARMSRPNQQKFLSQIDPADLSGFEQKYQAAIDRGWVKPLKKASNANQ
jgi:hypothetical protein